jgi:hypothetical protein
MPRITTLALVFVTAVTTATLSTSANAQRRNLNQIERDAINTTRDRNVDKIRAGLIGYTIETDFDRRRLERDKRKLKLDVYSGD